MAVALPFAGVVVVADTGPRGGVIISGFGVFGRDYLHTGKIPAWHGVQAFGNTVRGL